MDSDMPTKDTEKIKKEVVYIDGKPIRGIQEIKPGKITVSLDIEERGGNIAGIDIR